MQFEFDMMSGVLGVLVGLVAFVLFSKRNINRLAREMTAQKKEGKTMQLIHNPDNSITPVTLDLDDVYPNIMVPVNTDNGDILLYVPKAGDIETLEGCKVVNYVRGHTPSVSSQVAEDFYLLAEQFENLGIIPEQDTLVCLYDVLDYYEDDEDALQAMNQGIPIGEGYTTEWTMDRIKNMRNLKDTLQRSAIKPMQYQRTKQFLDKCDQSGYSNVRALVDTMENIDNIKKNRSELSKMFGKMDAKTMAPLIIAGAIGVFIVMGGI